MISAIKPSVWLLVLCCLYHVSAVSLEIDEDSNDCTIAKSSVSIGCGIAGAVVALGSISACVATAGAACGALAAIGAVAGICGTATGEVNCEEDSDTDKIIKLLGNIKSDIADVSRDVQIGFFDDKYESDIEAIQNAGEMYEKYVIREMKNGSLTDSFYTNEWIRMMETDYKMENTLMEIDDMITGEGKSGVNTHSSIYKIAREYNLCSPDLYHHVFNLLTQGTTLNFIYLQTSSKEDVDQNHWNDFEKRVLANERMYDTYCRNNVAIESFRIKISDRSYANSGGSIRIGVKQGENSCETDKEIFDKPKRNEEMTEDDEDKFGSCSGKWFQPRLNEQPLEIRILSNSGDDAYIDKAAIKIGGVWREWVDYQVKINKHGEGSTWKTVIYPESSKACINGGMCGYCEENACYKGAVDYTANNGFSNGYTVIKIGEELKSLDEKYTLKMQEDGNLVLYCNGTNALWASDTSDKTVEGGLQFQSDGNLVLYSPDRTALWSPNSYDKGVTSMVLQDDGNLVLYTDNGEAIWDSETYDKC
ncbi:uncharacterized protein LOC134820906 isoform X1 [Bolinopsis microptera]|uniref:uncharacterized protein LOC134820906 isoform X1 n=1 Tax=Bolinopsis microptera TaxID=2820187 RepID=UPI00307AD477